MDPIRKLIMKNITIIYKKVLREMKMALKTFEKLPLRDSYSP